MRLIPRSRPAQLRPATLARLAGGGVLAASLVGWTAHLAAISSLTHTPADVTTGNNATGTVLLDVTAKSATLSLSSSDTRVATVPSSLTITGATRGSFLARPPLGATGCTTIAARLGATSTRTAILAVHPTPTPTGSPLKVSLVSGTVVSGQTTSGRLLLPTTQTVSTVQLSSSDPSAATVPSSVQVPVNTSEVGIFGAGSFPIQTTPSGVLRCPVITATQGSATSKVMLKIFPISG